MKIWAILLLAVLRTGIFSKFTFKKLIIYHDGIGGSFFQTNNFNTKSTECRAFPSGPFRDSSRKETHNFAHHTIGGSVFAVKKSSSEIEVFYSISVGFQKPDGRGSYCISVGPSELKEEKRKAHDTPILEQEEPHNVEYTHHSEDHILSTRNENQYPLVPALPLKKRPLPLQTLLVCTNRPRPLHTSSK